MKAQKLLVGMAAFLLVAGLTFAAGGKEAAAAGAASTTPITLGMFANISWYNWPEWGSNEVSKLITQKTGVTIKFTWPAQGDDQQFNLMLASGDLPDFILNDQQDPLYEKPIQAGLVEDLGPLMDKYASDLRKRMGDGYWKFNAYQDGKNYAIINAEMHPGNIKRYIPVGPWNPGTFYLEDVYKAIGSPKIDTPDDLFNTLKTVQAKYPDLRPLWIGASPLNFTPQPYGYDYWFAQFGVEKYYDQNGQLSAKYKDPRYLDALLWLNKLYRQGLIKREDLASTDDQYRSEHDAGKIFYASTGIGNFNPETGYESVPANPAVKYVLAPMFAPATILQQGSIGWCGWMITTKAKDKARAIQFMAFSMSQQGEELQTFGIPTENWSYGSNGLPVRSASYLAAVKDNTIADYNKKWGVGAYWFNLDLYDHVMVLSDQLASPNWQKVLKMYVPHANMKMWHLNLRPVSDSPEAVILAKATKLYTDTFPSFILADSPEQVKANLADFIKKADALGMPQVEALWTKQSLAAKAIWKGVDLVTDQEKFTKALK